MSDIVENQILQAEERLRDAMLNSDVDVLDELLSSELIFTNHLGQLLTKADDLSAHRSGIVKINELTNSEQRILIEGQTVVVSVRTGLSGSYNGVESKADFRFTRVWSKSDEGKWQIVAGHSSIIA